MLLLSKSNTVHADGSGSSGSTGPVDESRLEAVLTGSDSASFRALVTTLDTLDISTPQGQRDALTAGFDGKCVAAVRVLLSTSENGDLTLSRRRRAQTQDAPSSDEEHPPPLQSLAARASTSVVPIGVFDLSDHTVESSRPSSRKAPTQRHRS